MKSSSIQKTLGCVETIQEYMSGDRLTPDWPQVLRKLAYILVAFNVQSVATPMRTRPTLTTTIFKTSDESVSIQDGQASAKWPIGW